MEKQVISGKSEILQKVLSELDANYWKNLIVVGAKCSSPSEQKDKADALKEEFLRQNEEFNLTLITEVNVSKELGN